MTNQVPTPAHQAFRERAANMKYGSSPDCDTAERWRNAFRCGMAAEHEVARLMGEIGALKRWKKQFFLGTNACRAISVEIIEAKAQLAALLEGK